MSRVPRLSSIEDFVIPAHTILIQYVNTSMWWINIQTDTVIIATVLRTIMLYYHYASKHCCCRKLVILDAINGDKHWHHTHYGPHFKYVPTSLWSKQMQNERHQTLLTRSLRAISQPLSERPRQPHRSPRRLRSCSRPVAPWDWYLPAWKATFLLKRQQLQLFKGY